MATMKSGWLLTIEVDKVTKEITDKVGAMVVERLKDRMDKEKKVFLSTAKDGIEYNSRDKRIESKVPHMEIIDLGAGPGHEVDINSLRDWVENSGKIAHSGDEKEITKITYKIANSIFKKGIYPSRVTLKTLTDISRSKYSYDF